MSDMFRVIVENNRLLDKITLSIPVQKDFEDLAQKIEFYYKDSTSRLKNVENSIQQVSQIQSIIQNDNLHNADFINLINKNTNESNNNLMKNITLNIKMLKSEINEIEHEKQVEMFSIQNNFIKKKLK